MVTTLLLFSALILAGHSESAPGAEDQNPVPISDAAPGTRTGTSQAGFRVTYASEKSGKYEALTGLTPTLGWYSTEWLQIRAELPIYWAHDNPSGAGIGVNLGVRAHALRYWRLSLFGELHGGALITSVPYPDEGTNFNFTYHGGIGTTIELTKGWELEIGGRFQHVSNGFVVGRAKNPASNMLGGFIGFSLPF